MPWRRHGYQSQRRWRLLRIWCLDWQSGKAITTKRRAAASKPKSKHVHPLQVSWHFQWQLILDHFRRGAECPCALERLERFVLGSWTKATIGQDIVVDQWSGRLSLSEWNKREKLPRHHVLVYFVWAAWSVKRCLESGFVYIFQSHEWHLLLSFFVFHIEMFEVHHWSRKCSSEGPALASGFWVSAASKQFRDDLITKRHQDGLNQEEIFRFWMKHIIIFLCRDHWV